MRANGHVEEYGWDSCGRSVAEQDVEGAARIARKLNETCCCYNLHSNYRHRSQGVWSDQVKQSALVHLIVRLRREQSLLRSAGRSPSVPNHPPLHAEEGEEQVDGGVHLSLDFG